MDRFEYEQIEHMDISKCPLIFVNCNHNHRCAVNITLIDIQHMCILILCVFWFRLGYGNITPRTALGKSITIFYAIIGMPLFLLYLSNIGDIMAKSFKWIYAKVCLCRICPGVAKRRESRNRRKLRAIERQLNEDYEEDVSQNIKNIATIEKSHEYFYYRKTIAPEKAFQWHQKALHRAL